MKENPTKSMRKGIKLKRNNMRDATKALSLFNLTKEKGKVKESIPNVLQESAGHYNFGREKE